VGAKRRALVLVQLAYAALSAAAAVALVFDLGPVSHAINQTSERIVGAALLAMGVGALAVARDPAANRIMLRVELVFIAACTVSLGWKMVIDEGAGPSTWALLAGLVVGLALLGWLAPAAADDPATGRRP
jgi:hypothetical protein